MAKNYCYNCTKRTIICHATCAEYAKFKEQKAKETLARNKEKWLGEFAKRTRGM